MYTYISEPGPFFSSSSSSLSLFFFFFFGLWFYCLHNTKMEWKCHFALLLNHNFCLFCFYSNDALRQLGLQGRAVLCNSQFSHDIHIYAVRVLFARPVDKLLFFVLLYIWSPYVGAGISEIFFMAHIFIFSSARDFSILTIWNRRVRENEHYDG